MKPLRLAIFMSNISLVANSFSLWKPRLGWLFLLPSRIPAEKNGIVLPESYTRRDDCGICFKAQVPFGEENEFLDKECFFAANSEFRMQDSETDFMFYVVHYEKVIMVRNPPEEVVLVSQAKELDKGLAFETIEHSRK